MKELNYENDTTIDPDSLDIEWLEQPKLMVAYAQHSARTRQQMEHGKERLDIVRAELDKEIRSEPNKFGIEKVTEGAINSTITTNEKFQEAQEEYRQAQYEFNMAQGAARAIDGKKDALENLVRLHGQQYFAGPQVPRDLSHEWKQKQEQRQSNQKVARSFKRKKDISQWIF